MLDALVLRPRSKGDLQEPANWIVEYAISFFPVLLFVLVLRSFLVEPFQIPTGSMIPTLKVGDFILVNKYAYGIRLPVAGTKIIDVGDPERGDSMVFIPPHEEEYFIKRVIGLPADRVRYQNKTLYINGVEQTQVFQQEVREFRPRQLEFEETFGDKPHAIYRNLYNDPRVQEWVVPEGHYFMMGDNRDQSNDSRFWGFVPDENVVGRAFAVWMHKDPGLSMPTFSTTRWVR